MFWLSAQIDSNVFGGSQPSVQDIRQEDEVCLFFFKTLILLKVIYSNCYEDSNEFCVFLFLGRLGCQGSIQHFAQNKLKHTKLSPNIFTTTITAIGCRQCLPLIVVQLKGKHCPKPHCHK